MSDETIEAEVMDDDSPAISSSALEAITNGEINQQVATAKKFPRNLAKFKTNAITAVTSTQEIAESCNYYLTRKGKDGIKVIEGPSIRLVEICMNFFCNTRWAGRVIGEDDKYIYAQGVVHDVENNNFVSEEVPRKITGANGKRFSADMVAVTGAAAKSIAMRNAVLRVIPRSYIDEIRLKAKERAQGNATNVLERWGKAVIFFKNFNVTEEQLLAKLERKAVADLTPDDIGKLIGLRTALKEGLTSIAEQFPPAVVEEEKEKPLEDAPAQPSPPASSDAATNKVADDLEKKKPGRPKKDKATVTTAATATEAIAAEDRGPLIAKLHETLMRIFVGDAEVIDSAISEVSKGTFEDWSAFAMRATVEQVRQADDAITEYVSKAPARPDPMHKKSPAGKEPEQQPLVPPAPEGNWIARVTKNLPKDEARATMVMRILKGAEMLELDERNMVKLIGEGIDMEVTSAETLNGLALAALTAVHRKLTDIANAK